MSVDRAIAYGRPFVANPPVRCGCGGFHAVPFGDCVRCSCGTTLCNCQSVHSAGAPTIYGYLSDEPAAEGSEG